MTNFHRLLASSSHALAQSLLRRVEKLQEGQQSVDVESVEDYDLEEQSISDSDAVGAAFSVRANGATAEEITQLLGLEERLRALELDSKKAKAAGNEDRAAVYGLASKVLIRLEAARAHLARFLVQK